MAKTALQKQPWMKFYLADWRADPRLKSCSLAARGLWIEMLCVMHEATPRGSLLVNGNPIPAKQLAGLVGASVKEVAGLLEELETAGVFSRDEDSVIYSRRMRRDDEKAEKAREFGSQGGNPRLKAKDNDRLKVSDKVQDNGRVNPTDKPSRARVPEARSQILEEAANAASSRAPIDKDFLKKVEDACRRALGEAAPADAVIGPIALVAERHTLARVIICLQSEARRPRKSPIRTWQLWADIVDEQLSRTPSQGNGSTAPAPKPKPKYERTTFMDGFRPLVTDANLLVHIERFFRDGTWIFESPPPGEPGCKVPADLLEGLERI
jgi:hypothetical protein